MTETDRDWCLALPAALDDAIDRDDRPAFTVAPCLVTLAGAIATVTVLVTSILLPVLSGTARRATLGLGIAIATLATYAAWSTPALSEGFRRRTAAGAAPELVAYAVLQARLTPSLERAARFAIDQSAGPLGDSLSTAIARAGTGREGWETFAADWSDVDETLSQSVALLAAGIDSGPSARDALLDRALDTTLAGSRERVATFASDVRAPATGIYAFGVLLPLAMVGLLPVAASAGVGVTPAAIAVLYDGLIPVGLLAASTWLAARRPAVSRPPTGRGAFASSRSQVRTALVGLIVGAGATGVGAVALPPWATGILVPGSAMGAAAVYWFDPIRERRRRVESIERGVPDAVALVGHRLAAGEPLEAAIEAVADRLSGDVATVFDEGARIHRRLRVTVAAAFTGPVGALSDVDSPRTETGVALLVAAARNGRAGGETLVTVSGYLRDLADVEREARRELARTTDTLRQTALVFGPAIAGVTVALATGMGSLGDATSAVPVPALGVVIGVYVLALAVVLPALSVVLERGLDGGLVGYRVGVALATASVVYPVTYLAASTVVQV